MAPIDSWKERRPSTDGAPSISIAFRGEKIGAAALALPALARLGIWWPARPVIT